MVRLAHVVRFPAMAGKLQASYRDRGLTTTVDAFTEIRPAHRFLDEGGLSSIAPVSRGVSPPRLQLKPLESRKSRKRKTVISKDGFEGMVRPERRQSWRLGETDLHQAIDANASVTQVTNSATRKALMMLWMSSISYCSTP